MEYSVKKIGGSLYVILDKTFIRKNDIKEGHIIVGHFEVENIIKDGENYDIIVRCPKCGNFVLTPRNADVADCDDCDYEIKNVDFDEVIAE